MWLFFFFLSKTASAVFNGPSNPESSVKKPNLPAIGRARYFTINSQVDSFLLNKYEIDEVHVETESEKRRFKQPSGMTTSQYVKDLLMKAPY